MKLIVIEPFAGHERGDFLTESEACNEALSQYPNSVRRVQDDPKPEIASVPPPPPSTSGKVAE